MPKPVLDRPNLFSFFVGVDVILYYYNCFSLTFPHPSYRNVSVSLSRQRLFPSWVQAKLFASKKQHALLICSCVCVGDSMAALISCKHTSDQRSLWRNGSFRKVCLSTNYCGLWRR